MQASANLVSRGGIVWPMGRLPSIPPALLREGTCQGHKHTHIQKAYIGWRTDVLCALWRNPYAKNQGTEHIAS